MVILVLLFEALQVVLEGLDGVALVIFLPTNGADEGVLAALVVEADEVQFLAIMIFIITLSILDPVFGLGRLYHHQLIFLKAL